MKPDRLTPVSIDSIEGLVTNIELQDLSQNFALELDGFRNTKGKTVGQRDFGSRHLYALPPLRPNAFYRISQIAFSGGTATVTLTDAVGAGIVGTVVPVWIDENLASGLPTVYNGAWNGTVVSTTSITFSITSGQGTVTGGILSLAPVQLVQGTAFYDPVRKRTFDIVCGLDSSGYYHLFVYDADPFTGVYKWIDLTASYSASVSSVVASGPWQLTLGTISYGGGTWTQPSGFTFNNWRGWYVFNTRSKVLGVIFGCGQVSTNLKVLGGQNVASAFQAGDSLVISNSRDVARHLTVGIPTSFIPQEAQEKVVVLQTAGDGTPLPALRIQYRTAMTQGFPENAHTGEANAVENTVATPTAGAGMPGTSLLYRVYAVFGSGATADEGDAGSWVVVPSSASYVNIALTWNAVAGADHYVLERYRIDTGASASRMYRGGILCATNSYTDDNSGFASEFLLDLDDPAVADSQNFLQNGINNSCPTFMMNTQAGWFLELSSLPAGYVAAADVVGGTGSTNFAPSPDYHLTGQNRIVSQAVQLDSNGIPEIAAQVSAAIYDNTAGGPSAGKSPNFQSGPPSPETRANLLAWYVTLIYDGYQESDPILGGRMWGGSSSTVLPNLVMDPIWVSVQATRSQISQRIRAVNFYLSAQYLTASTPISGIVISPSSYRLAKTFVYRQVASEFAIQVLPWRMGSSYVSLVPMATPGGAGAGPLSAVAGPVGFSDLIYLWFEFSGDQPGKLSTLGIDAAIGRTPLTVNDLGVAARKILTPRYAAKPSRFQTALVAIDSDDNTLNLAVVDGYNTLEDENFCQVVRDVNSNQTVFELQSRGKLLGLADQRGILVGLKSSEIELIDPYSGSQETQSADVASPRSICRTEFGLVWAGRYGLYLLPITGGPIKKINEQWADVYDGTTLTAGGNPYVQDPTAIVTGYSRLYKEAIFSAMAWNDNANPAAYVPTFFRYSFATGRWAFRRLSLSGSATPVPVPTSGANVVSVLLSVLNLAIQDTHSSQNSTLNATLSLTLSDTSP